MRKQTCLLKKHGYLEIYKLCTCISLSISRHQNTGIQLSFNKVLLILYHYKSAILSWPSRTFPDPIITSLILSTLSSSLSYTRALFHKLFSYISFLLCCILARKTFSELLSHLSVLSCLQIPKKNFILFYYFFLNKDFTFLEMEIIFACSEEKKIKN